MTEKEALVLVAEGLRAGQWPHTQQWLYPIHREEMQEPVGFNMCFFYSVADCGTVCCIGGLVEWLADITISVGHHPLYVPQRLAYNRLTPEQAAQAIDNYLAGATDPWEFAR